MSCIAPAHPWCASVLGFRRDRATIIEHGSTVAHTDQSENQAREGTGVADEEHDNSRAMARACDRTFDRWIPGGSVTSTDQQAPRDVLDGCYAWTVPLRGTQFGSLALLCGEAALERLGSALAASAHTLGVGAEAGSETLMYALVRDLGLELTENLDPSGAYTVLHPLMFHGKTISLQWDYPRKWARNVRVGDCELEFHLGFEPPHAPAMDSSQRDTMIATLRTRYLDTDPRGAG